MRQSATHQPRRCAKPWRKRKEHWMKEVDEGIWARCQFGNLSSKDQRQHLYIIGKTGSGKTTLLRNLILQHIALGHGVGLIDPHGDLAKELLNHIPPAPCRPFDLFQSGRPSIPRWIECNWHCGTRWPGCRSRNLCASAIVARSWRGFLEPAETSNHRAFSLVSKMPCC